MSLPSIEILYQASLDPELGPAALRVLVWIVKHANWTSGHCWPAQTTIAKALGIKKQSVNRQIQILVRGGYLEKSRKTLLNGANTTCDYVVKLPDTPVSTTLTDPQKIPSFAASNPVSTTLTPVSTTLTPRQHEADAINVLKTELKKDKPPTPFSDDFQKLWEAWEPFKMPHGNRPQAERIYARIRRKGISAEQVMLEARRYCQKCRDDRCKTKRIENWLRQCGRNPEGKGLGEGENGNGADEKQPPADAANPWPSMPDQPWKKTAREILDDGFYRAWIPPLWLEGRVLHCPSAFCRDRLKDYHKQALERAIGHEITFTANPPPHARLDAATAAANHESAPA